MTTPLSFLSDPLARLLAGGGPADSAARLLGGIAPTGSPPSSSEGDSYAAYEPEQSVWRDIGEVTLCLGSLGILCAMGCGGEGYTAGALTVSNLNPEDNPIGPGGPHPDAIDTPHAPEIGDAEGLDTETTVDGDATPEVADAGDASDTLDAAETQEIADGFSDADVIDSIDLVCLGKEIYCDGEDDDCNGVADDFPELGQACVAAAAGACAAGTLACLPPRAEEETGSLTLLCQPGDPQQELCNAVDDNCNGATDEPFNLGTACTVSPPVGQGACANTNGSFVCAPDGQAAVCAVTPLPQQPEVCNAADDDCDGLTDELLGNTTCGTGACTTTVPNCLDGLPQECTASMPSKEVCNGADDDCDGKVDELLDNTLCGVGACLTTVASCLDGVPQECTPGTPATEVCNTADDNCDGLLDNVQGSGDPCTLGLGLCVSNGTWACDPALGTKLFCNAAILEPQKELCDGQDNDCNGLIDEQLGTASCGVGACAVTTEKCVDGAPQTCTPAKSGTEKCNAIDDDCDGATDELLGSTSCGVGACKVTTESCVNGAPQPCTPAQPGTEVCNTVDDNCDGILDNMPGKGSPCTIGLGLCISNGTWACDPAVSLDLYCKASVIAPTLEVCDGLDNDCDGVTDEVGAGIVNTDGDTLCDAIDPDDDNDGVEDLADNCLLVVNSDQADFDVDGVGDRCDDSDGDGVVDATDNCKTVANPDQAKGIAPNGLACTPQCAPQATQLAIQSGETAVLAFQVSAAEVFDCDTTLLFFGPDPEELLKTHLAELSVAPTADTTIDTCTVTGFGVTAACPSVTVDVNHAPEVIDFSPLGPGVLPDGSGAFINTNKIPFSWWAVDADGDPISCQVGVYENGKKIAAALAQSTDGSIFSAAIAAGFFAPRTEYCAQVDCNDDQGGLSTTGAELCFTTSEQDLIVWLPFNEGAGLLANDYSGKGNHGVLAGNPLPAWTVASGLPTIAFAGKGDHLTLGTSASLTSPQKTMSIALWIKPQALTDTAFLNKHTQPQSGWYFSSSIDGRLRMLIFKLPPGGSNDYVTSAGAITAGTGQWTHIGAVFDGSHLQIYVNGQKTAGQEVVDGEGGDIKNAPAPLMMGKESWSSATTGTYNGAIDDLLIYRKALTAEQIQALATSPH